MMQGLLELFTTGIVELKLTEQLKALGIINVTFDHVTVIALH